MAGVYNTGNDDIGHHVDIGHKHIGHKARHVFVRLVNQGGQCAAASQGSDVADGISKKIYNGQFVETSRLHNCFEYTLKHCTFENVA